MIFLYTTFFNEKNPARLKEYLYCINENANNPLIDKIIILCEKINYRLSVSEKIHQVAINERPLFQDIFKLVNNFSSADTLNIIANTDIYFDEKIGIIQNTNFPNDKVYCLTRWNNINGRWELDPDSYMTQDAWILKGKVKNILSDFSFGIPGCENRLAYELKCAGYQISNPSLTIKPYHKHQVDIRNYSTENTKRIPGPYIFLPPRFILSKIKIDSAKSSLGLFIKFYYKFSKEYLVRKFKPTRLFKLFIKSLGQ